MGFSIINHSFWGTPHGNGNAEAMTWDLHLRPTEEWNDVKRNSEPCGPNGKSRFKQREKHERNVKNEEKMMKCAETI